MKYIISIILFATMLFMVSCSSSKVAKASKSTVVAEDFVLYLERTACFGRCPAFTMTVTSDGAVSYNGMSHTEVKGQHKKQVSKNKVKELAFLVESGDFWKYKDRYDDENITDLPSFIIQVTHNDKNKKIVARVGIPPELSTLFNSLETTVGMEGFKPASD